MNGSERDSVQCPICGGIGVRSVYAGNMGGSVDCNLCGGTGKVAISTTGSGKDV